MFLLYTNLERVGDAREEQEHPQKPPLDNASQEDRDQQSLTMDTNTIS